MQIEAGKYYRTRDGRRVGPMKVWPSGDGEWESLETFTDGLWKDDGSPLYGDMEYRDSPTLVAEWSEGPVRTETVTKRRIVPGVYGRLAVGEPTKFPDCDRPDGPPRFEVGLALEGWEGFTADELDALADTARQLAEALRDMD